MEPWFNLPGGETARELELTVPVRGRVRFRAEDAAEVEALREMLADSMRKSGHVHHGRLSSMLASCVSQHEQTASAALAGAEQVRDDVLCYLRSVAFAIETATCDHTSHAEKNARLRGILALLERHIQSLREEKFNFRDALWRRSPDLFAWREPERRLRERVRELEAEVAELRKGDGGGRPDERDCGF